MFVDGRATSAVPMEVAVSPSGKRTCSGCKVGWISSVAAIASF